MRVSLGFEPAWFHQRCEVEFGERWHTDPRYRRDSLVVCKRELQRAFPATDYWDALSDADMWTLSGAYGAYPIARLYGYLNWQGVLNNAFILVGQSIFTDMVERPELAHRFFDFISNLMIRLATMIQARQTQSGFTVDHLLVSNCTINMVSARFYREFVFPYDQKIAGQFSRFGVHTCNWNATPYLQNIAQLPKVGYIDMGIETNLAQAKSLFPEARRAVMYSPVKVQDAPRDEIENDMRKIRDAIAPCDIVLADIQATTPDSRVNELVQICHTLEGSAQFDSRTG